MTLVVLILITATHFLLLFLPLAGEWVNCLIFTTVTKVHSALIDVDVFDHT